MKLRTRILIIVIAALAGMLAIGTYGLIQLRKSMYQERTSQIAQMLDVANAQLKYFQSLETAGKMSRDEAQARAKESIAAQRTADNYFIVRILLTTCCLSMATPHVSARSIRAGKPSMAAR